MRLRPLEPPVRRVAKVSCVGCVNTACALRVHALAPVAVHPCPPFSLPAFLPNVSATAIPTLLSDSGQGDN
eukprot:352115-Chlamydomonas_euryale.AAC.2